MPSAFTSQRPSGHREQLGAAEALPPRAGHNLAFSRFQPQRSSSRSVAVQPCGHAAAGPGSSRQGMRPNSGDVRHRALPAPGSAVHARGCTSVTTFNQNLYENKTKQSTLKPPDVILAAETKPRWHSTFTQPTSHNARSSLRTAPPYAAAIKNISKIIPQLPLWICQ